MSEQKVLSTTARELLTWGAETLSGCSFDDPALEARAILSGLLGCSLTSLHLRAAEAVSEELSAEYRRLIERRRRYEPVAYLLGAKNFMGRDFKVTPQVLIP